MLVSGRVLYDILDSKIIKQVQLTSLDHVEMFRSEDAVFHGTGRYTHQTSKNM